MLFQFLVFSGLKVIKTETIERINESDEGSMQNVGTYHKNLHLFHLYIHCTT